MKLRTKLLLGVGLLLFAMAILMYLLPAYFVRKDVLKAAEEIHTLILAEQQQLHESQKLWLHDALNTLKRNNNSILNMLEEIPYLASDTFFGTENLSENIWINLSRISGFDPTIGFVQAHALDKNETAVITPATAKLYSIDTFTKTNETTELAHISLIEKGENRYFVALLLPESMQKEKGYTLFLLLAAETERNQLTIIQKEIEKMAQQIKLNQKEKSTHIPESSPSILTDLWAIKVSMIRSLAPLYVAGNVVSKEHDFPATPKGVARLDTSGNGYVVLTNEIFSIQPIFDDTLYYKSHLPITAEIPVASDSFIVTAPNNEMAYLGNTVLLGSKYYSIGTPVDFLAHQLALSGNRMVLMQVKQNYWQGFDRNGHLLPQGTLEAFVRKGAFNQEGGVFQFENENFSYFKVSELENENLIFFDVRPSSSENSIISTLLSLEDTLTHRISWQLSLIALGTMILVLIFIGRIGFTIIYPIMKLANTTEDVVAGRYEDITLPKMGTRKDEVAILIRSFEDMVKGLKEREEIRGVLDKVVSKDVAEEILKTEIHLGGEDRIISILFSDIRGFSELTSNKTPQETIHFLNACMTKVSRVIEGEGGVIDKYVGDEVMAIFGAPAVHPDHALRAVSTGMLIVETLKKWNQQRVQTGEELIEMGIGVHTGLVVVGNMGAEDRLNYTVLGTNVNLAARLCEIAKPNQLIISEATLSEPNIQDSFFVQTLQPIFLKGFANPVPIYEVTGFKWDVER